MLGQDGNPPLYYLLLHGWMRVAGTSEAATRSLSLIFALLAVPASFWAGARGVRPARGRARRGRRGAGCPFLTLLRAGDADVLARRAALDPGVGELRARVRARASAGTWSGSACGSALLLYTHTWGLFLTGAMAGAWLVLYRRGRVAGRDGAAARRRPGRALSAVAAGVVSQAAHTAAPWAERPSPLLLLGFAVGALRLSRAAAAGGRGVLRHPPAPAGRQAVRVLAGLAVGTAVLAWLGSQIEPAWATRYFAVVLGPLVLALASVVSKGARWTALALVGVGGVWLLQRAAADEQRAHRLPGVAPAIRPGDVVVSTQPEQVPALIATCRAACSMSPRWGWCDPRQTDWRNGLTRLRAGKPSPSWCPRSTGWPAAGGS